MRSALRIPIYILVISAIVTCLGLQRAHAGDPTVKRFKFALSEYVVGDSAQWTVEVDNPFAFPATKYRASFHIVNKNDPSDTEIFEVPEFDFSPTTTLDVSIAPRWWTARRAGSYYVEYRSSSPDDIDTTNNTMRHDFSVTAPSLLDRSAVTAMLRWQMTNEWKLNMDLALGYVTQEPLQGCTITSKDDSEFTYTVDSTQWFAWVDTDKYSEYTKDQYFVIIDRKDSTILSFHTSWYPLIDGEPYPGTDGASAQDDITVGTPPEPEAGSGTHLSDPVSQEPPKKRACALIIAGGDESGSAYRDRFVNGADFMKGNLTRERNGARIHPDDVTVLNDPTPEELSAALRSFRDKCETFYFVYTGHGGEYAMSTRDSSLLWINLMIELDSVNASNYQMMISSCHAGAAIDNFDDVKWRYRDADVTIVASSAADTSSYSQAIVTGGGDTITVSRYLWAFAQCYGDPSVDRNGDTVTSFEEAHRWVLRQNPQISWAGKGIVEVQRPQIRIHARTVPKTEPVSLRDADLEVYPRYISDTTATLTAEITTVDTPEPKEDSIVYISTERMWDLDYNIKGSFRVDMQWTYNEDIDSLPPLTGGKRLGVVRRDSSGEKWTRHYPTLWLPKSNTLKAIDVTGFSDWAIAVIENSAPVATGATITTARDTESAPVTPWVADRDTGDTFTFAIASQPTNGTARVEANALRYLPAANFTGTDSFSFRATDAGGGSIVGNAQVTVTGSNRPPIAEDDNGQTAEDTSIDLHVVTNDTDPDGDELRIVQVDQPRHGAAIVIGDTLIRYTPAENYFGADSLGYTVADPGGLSATATVTLEVTPVNDPPSAFTRLSPGDGSSSSALETTFSWSTSSDIDGDAITYILLITAGANNEEYTTMDTSTAIDFSSYNLGTGTHAVTWRLRATDGSDTTAATNGEGSFTLDLTTRVRDLSQPLNLHLEAVYPNPAQAGTSVVFSLMTAGRTRLDLFALTGVRIKTVLDEWLVPGRYEWSVPLRELPAGWYLLGLTQDGRRETRIISIQR